MNFSGASDHGRWHHRRLHRRRRHQSNGGANAANQGGKLPLAKSGSGTLTLSNANTYSGGTVLNTGTLVVGNDNALGSGDLTMAAGTALSFQGSRTIANNIGLTGDLTFTVNAGTTSTISGVISDTSPGPNAGVLEKEGAGTLVLSGTNPYSGGTTINSGTLALSGTGSIAQSSVADNATFDISATNSGASITSLSGSGTVTLGSKTLTLSNAGDTFSGRERQRRADAQQRRRTLSGVNDYLGATTINRRNPNCHRRPNRLGLRNGQVFDGGVGRAVSSLPGIANEETAIGIRAAQGDIIGAAVDRGVVTEHDRKLGRQRDGLVRDGIGECDGGAWMGVSVRNRIAQRRTRTSQCVGVRCYDTTGAGALRLNIAGP